MVILRYKELWGDQGSESDVLTVNGQSVCNPTTCPLNKEVNGLFAADFNHDSMSETNQTWPPYQNASPHFISAVDVFAPAQNPPTGEVNVSLEDRGAGPLHTITFPNFEGTTDVVTVQFDDFTLPATVTSHHAARHRRSKRHRRRHHHSRRTRHHRPRRVRGHPSFTG
jgi:hypothetical protein